MANVYLNLPLPPSIGPGTAVNTSTMGAAKTVTCTGNLGRACITIEVSVDGGSSWAPLCIFQGGGRHSLTTQIACDRMRTNVRNRSPNFSANVDVAADDNGCDFDALPVPALGVTFGAPLDVSAYGRYLTFICGGLVGGAIIEVQGSEDGSSYVPITTFQDNAIRMARVEFVAKFLRLRVSNRKAIVPFTATVGLGASIWDPGTLPTTPPPITDAPKSYLPERWQATNVPGTQAAAAMASGASQIVDDLQVFRAGSIIGLGLRFDDALTGGDATAEVYVNGVATGIQVTVSSGSGGEYTVANLGDYPFAAGDFISVWLATVAMTPAASLSCEATVEIGE